MSEKDEDFEALIERWAAEGLVDKMSKRFLSLLFLKSDWEDLVACLSFALAERSFSLALSTASGVGEREIR